MITFVLAQSDPIERGTLYKNAYDRDAVSVIRHRFVNQNHNLIFCVILFQDADCIKKQELFVKR